MPTYSAVSGLSPRALGLWTVAEHVYAAVRRTVGQYGHQLHGFADGIRMASQMGEPGIPAIRVHVGKGATGKTSFTSNNVVRHTLQGSAEHEGAKEIVGEHFSLTLKEYSSEIPDIVAWAAGDRPAFKHAYRVEYAGDGESREFAAAWAGCPTFFADAHAVADKFMVGVRELGKLRRLWVDGPTFAEILLTGPLGELAYRQPGMHVVLMSCGTAGIDATAASTCFERLRRDVRIIGHAPTYTVAPRALTSELIAHYPGLSTDAHPPVYVAFG